ncbi:MAG: DNA-protecting protein DprA [Magnetococcales bacterium]|nr:DNA-protecting protein DprA [Magnetococcales bacterium]
MKPVELTDWLRLVQIPGLGPVGIKKLLEHFGHPLAVVQASESDYRNVPGMHPQITERLATFRQKLPLQPVLDHLQRLREMGAGVTILGDLNYPPMLAQIYDPPPVLYYLGDIGQLVGRRMVAVVGSRRASYKALDLARRLSLALVSHRITVVSGLALGIDTAAHRGALEGGGETVAVSAVGLDVYYPPDNRNLVQKIIARGCQVTEATLGTRPDAFRFPQRNRIISGLVHAVLVVEAGAKSGALITARLALEQGREVFAVPGTGGDWQCRGSNHLLKQGAGMVEEARDILLEMNWSEQPLRKNTSPGDGVPRNAVRVTGADSVEDHLLQCLAGGPVQADDLSRKTQLTVAALSSILLRLELAGMVIRLPGNQFALQNGPSRDTTF